MDLTTPHGRAMAQVTGVFAELERAMIVERTRAALAERKAAGARLGRPVGLPDDVRQRIAGWVIRVDGDQVAFDEVDTKARWTGETFGCEVDDLISADESFPGAGPPLVDEDQASLIGQVPKQGVGSVSAGPHTSDR